MEIRKLRQLGGRGSSGVALPKDMLRDDGVVGPDGLEDDQYVSIERVDDGQYELRLVGLGE